ncbi:hypothetical protein DTL42_19000 [Bremerella cremea]|uniref:Hedgehog/Intein (Hint) domain-containing protein n=1 Tax=Bremerella cremea TaxID=1031537 RepID=A0A368KMK6_9BACT|nr:hypothetical protein DTL42_19000 [Bremerella cremea]
MALQILQRLPREPEPLGVTENHPIWSEDRLDYVPAGERTVGERLDASGTIAAIKRIEEREGDHRVYNLEVQGDHVCRITSSGLFVQNTCVDSPYQVHINPHTRKGPMAIDTSVFRSGEATLNGGVRNARSFW